MRFCSCCLLCFDLPILSVVQVWMKVKRVCMQLRYQRCGNLGGLVGATHLSLLKTMETGGRQWYDTIDEIPKEMPLQAITGFD